MAIKFYNTLKKDYEDFVPIADSKVGIYMCGMTVQDRPHLGHMRTFIFGDVLRRYLEYKGYEVIYIQNFTDIDDKIIQRSKAEKVDWRALGDKYEQEFLKSSEILNLKPATYYPKATQFIQEIIELITILIEKGFAYVSNGNVYFEVGKFKGYGKLSGKNIEDLKESFRIEPDPNKKNLLDFALWKAHKEGEPYWYSPWGKGRPGWHIECSVMSTHFLGQPFDIHMGGQDLIFPHHEDEIAQSEAAYGREFVRYWIHSAPMLIKGEKMSKSTGFYFAIGDLLERYTPEAIRLFILQKHYRSPVEYMPEYIEEAERAISRLKSFLNQISVKDGKIIPDRIKEFEKAMEDDLNTPKAISIAFELLKEGNIKLQKGENAASEAATIFFILEILGFRTANFTTRSIDTEKISKLVRLILDVRQELRKTKNFELADKIRSELYHLGIKVKDTRDGTIFEL